MYYSNTIHGSLSKIIIESSCQFVSVGNHVLVKARGNMD